MAQANETSRIQASACALTVTSDGEVCIAAFSSSTVSRRWPDEQAFVEAVRRGEIRARRWAIVVPRCECLVKRASFPTRDPEEAEAMLSFEVPEFLPVRSEALHYDSVRNGASQDEKTDLVVWLLLDSKLGRHMNVLTEAGIQPAAVVPSSLGLQRWLAIQDKDDDGAKQLLIAAYGSSKYEVVLSHGERLLWSRQFQLDESQRPDFAEVVAESLRPDSQQAADATTTLDDVDRIVLLGDPATTALLGEQVTTVLSSVDGSETPAVKIIDEPGLPEEQEAWVERSLKGAAHGLATGLALHPNILPRALVEQRDRSKQRHRLAATVGLAGLAAALLWGYLALGTWRLERQYDRLAAAIVPIQDVATELERKKRQLRAVQDQLSNRDLPLRILGELYRYVPSGTSLSDVVIMMRPAGADVVIRGLAPAVHTAYELPEHLSRSDLLGGVRVVRADTAGSESEAATFECHAKAGG